jgi:hypothetical protein
MEECFAHKLRHDTKATNLDLYVPIVDVVFEGSDKNLTSRSGDDTHFSSNANISRVLQIYAVFPHPELYSLR